MILVTWNPAIGAVSYEVSATTPGGPNALVTVPDTSAELSVPASKAYQVIVTGINSAGVKGPPSAAFSYVPPALPDQVTGVVVVSGS